MRRLAWIAAVGVTACSPGPDGNRAEPVTADAAIGNDALANVADNAAEPAKSILRPEIVAPEPAPPALEPVAATVAFGASGLVLDDAGRAAIDALLASPTAAAGGPITVRGHSDSPGNDRVNLRASQSRAEAVRDYLVEKGIATDRITVVALGETTPLVPNARPDGSDDPEARARNRRVELTVDLPAPPAEAPVADQDNAAG